MFEAPDLPRFELPGELAAPYGGAIGFPKVWLYANFVESIDGVTAIPDLVQSNRLIAAGSEQDRFIMGLLRACADAVLVGSGTFFASPQTRWTAEHAYPPLAERYAELRRRRGMPAQPALAIVSGSGRLDANHPGFEQPAIVLTSRRGAKLLEDALPPSAEIVALGEHVRLDVSAAVRLLRDRGYRTILCEGGPTLLGALIESNLLDELFLTISPRLAGRSANLQRLSLIENTGSLRDRPIGAHLRSVRRSGSHLFLRYAPETAPDRRAPTEAGTVSAAATARR